MTAGEADGSLPAQCLLIASEFPPRQETAAEAVSAFGGRSLCPKVVQTAVTVDAGVT